MITKNKIINLLVIRFYKGKKTVVVIGNAKVEIAVIRQHNRYQQSTILRRN